jgi:hypothetical protein
MFSSCKLFDKWCYLLLKIALKVYKKINNKKLKDSFISKTVLNNVLDFAN